ncbi:MAG: Arc family DNA-binding protein [Thiolinea sp.]
MSQLLIRNLEAETVEKLKARAKNNHRSLQAEVQLILEQAARIQPGDFWKNANYMRSRLQATDGTFSDSAELLREDRDR